MKERFTLDLRIPYSKADVKGQAIAISLMSLEVILATSYFYKIDEIITVPGIPAHGRGVEIA